MKKYTAAENFWYSGLITTYFSFFIYGIISFISWHVSWFGLRLTIGLNLLCWFILFEIVEITGEKQ